MIIISATIMSTEISTMIIILAFLCINQTSAFILPLSALSTIQPINFNKILSSTSNQVHEL